MQRIYRSFCVKLLAETDTGLWDSCQPTTSPPLLLFRPSKRCAGRYRGSLIRVFSRARWQRGDGWDIIRFSAICVEAFFFNTHARAFQGAAALTAGLISGVRRENPSSVRVPVRLPFILAETKKSSFTGPTLTTNKCANIRDFREGYFDVERVCIVQIAENTIVQYHTWCDLQLNLQTHSFSTMKNRENNCIKYNWSDCRTFWKFWKISNV